MKSFKMVSDKDRVGKRTFKRRVNSDHVQQQGPWASQEADTTKLIRAVGWVQPLDGSN